MVQVSCVAVESVRRYVNTLLVLPAIRRAEIGHPRASRPALGGRRALSARGRQYRFCGPRHSRQSRCGCGRHGRWSHGYGDRGRRRRRGCQHTDEREVPNVIDWHVQALPSDLKHHVRVARTAPTSFDDVARLRHDREPESGRRWSGRRFGRRRGNGRLTGGFQFRKHDFRIAVGLAHRARRQALRRLDGCDREAARERTRGDVDSSTTASPSGRTECRSARAGRPPDRPQRRGEGLGALVI